MKRFALLLFLTSIFAYHTQAMEDEEKEKEFEAGRPGEEKTETGRAQLERIYRAALIGDLQQIHEVFTQGVPEQVLLALLEKAASENKEHFITIFFNAAISPSYAFPLSWAASNGYITILDWLLKHRASVDEVDRCGMQPIHYAARGGHVEALKFLVSRGAKADAHIKRGDPLQPIHEAASAGHVNALQWLLEQPEVNVNAAVGPSRIIPLNRAAEHGRLDAIIFLVNNGADVNAQNSWGAAPLYFASSDDNRAAVEFLLKHGAIVNTQTSTGAEATHTAMYGMKNTETLQLLLEYGGNLNALTNELHTNPSETPLDVASEDSYLDSSIAIIEWLLIHGAEATYQLLDSNDVPGSVELFPLVKAVLEENSNQALNLLTAMIENKESEPDQALLNRVFPLTVALNQKDVVKMILRHFSGSLSEQSIGEALLAAAAHGNKPIFDQIYNSAQTIFRQNELSRILEEPLHWAALLRREDMVHSILNRAFVRMEAASIVFSRTRKTINRIVQRPETREDDRNILLRIKKMLDDAARIQQTASIVEGVTWSDDAASRFASLFAHLPPELTAMIIDWTLHPTRGGSS